MTQIKIAMSWEKKRYPADKMHISDIVPQNLSLINLAAPWRSVYFSTRWTSCLSAYYAPGITLGTENTVTVINDTFLAFKEWRNQTLKTPCVQNGSIEKKHRGTGLWFCLVLFYIMLISFLMTVANALLSHCLYKIYPFYKFSLGSTKFHLLGEVILDHLQDITNIIFIIYWSYTRY